MAHQSENHHKWMTKIGVKRLLRVCLAAGTALILLMLVGYGLLRTAPVQKVMKQRLIDALHARINGRLEIDRLSGNLISTLSFHRIRLYDRQELTLAADRVSLSYFLPMLLTNTVWISRVQIDGLQLNARQLSDGTWNIAALVPATSTVTDEPESDATFDLVLKRLQVTRGQVELTPAATSPQTVRRISDIYVDTDLDLYRPLAMRLHRASFTLENPDIAITGMKGRITYDPVGKTLKTKALSISTPDSLLALAVDLDLKQTVPRINAALNLTPLSLTDIARAVGAPAYNRGEIEGKITVTGTLDALEYLIELRHRQQALTMMGQANYHKDGLLDLVCRCDVKKIDPFYWMPDATTEGKSSLNAKLFIASRDLLSEERSGRLEIDLFESSILGIPFTQGRIAAALAADRLEISDTRFHSPFGNVQLYSKISGLTGADQQRVSITAALTAIDLDQILADDKVTGTVNGDLQLNAVGRLDPAADLDVGAWTAELDARIDSTTLFDTTVNHADLSAVWDGRTISLKRFELASDLVTADLSGAYVPEDTTVQGKVTSRLADLHQLTLALKPLQLKGVEALAPTGSLDLSVNINGKEGQYRLTASGHSPRGGVADMVLTDAELAGQLRYDALGMRGTLNASAATLMRAGQQLRQVETAIEWTADRITARLNAQHPAAMIALSGHLDGWSHPEKTVHLDVLQITPPESSDRPLFQRIVTQQPARIHIRPNGMSIDAFELWSDFGQLSAEGQISTEGNQNLNIKLKEVHLSRLNTLLETERFPEGWLSAQMAVGGTLSAPRVETQIILSRDNRNPESTLTVDANLTYDQQHLAATLLASDAGRQFVTAEGHMGLQLSLKPLTARLLPGSLDARVDVSDVALSELPLPTVWHETIGGTVRGQLHASGDVASPQLTGTVSVRNGVLQHKDLDRVYRPITVDIKLTPGAIAIEQMKYRGKNDAQLDCTGKIGLKGLTPTIVKLYLTGQRVTLPYRRAITTRFDPELRLTGSYAAPHLEGKVTIREARISLDQIVDEGPSDIVVLKDGGDVNQTIQFADEPDTSDGLSDRLSAELAVDARRNVWIKGQDIDAEISGNLKLKKERRKPARLTGRLKPVRGRYDFYGRRFTITDGWIDFIGKPDPDPYFDIWAETKIKDVTIILNLTRKVKKIEVELSSRPEMQQSDIISYLVFGRRTDELRGQQSAGAEMSAMAIGGKVAAAELERILGQTGVVDTFTLDMGSEDLTQGSASIGKYVTPDLFVIYRYEFSTDTPNEIEIDYQINKNFSIRSQYGNEKTTGIDLIWQHDFNRLSDD